MTPSPPTPDSGAEPRGALWQRAVVGVFAAAIAAIAWLPGWLAYAAYTAVLNPHDSIIIPSSARHDPIIIPPSSSGFMTSANLCPTAMSSASYIMRPCTVAACQNDIGSELCQSVLQSRTYDPGSFGMYLSSAKKNQFCPYLL